MSINIILIYNMNYFILLERINYNRLKRLMLADPLVQQFILKEGRGSCVITLI